MAELRQRTFDTAVEAVQHLVLQPGDQARTERALHALAAFEAELGDPAHREIAAIVTQLSQAVGAAQQERFVALLFELRETVDRRIESERRARGRLRHDLGVDRDRLLQVTDSDRRTIERALGRGDALYEVYIEGAAVNLELIERIERRVSVVRSILLRGAKRAGFLIVSATEPDLGEYDLGAEVTVRSDVLDPRFVLGRTSLSQQLHGGDEAVQLSTHHAGLERTWFYLRQAQQQADERQRDLLLELERALRSTTTVALRDLLLETVTALEDLAAEEGKRVRIGMHGYPAGIHAEAATTLRKVLHELIANAIRHGIETPAERRAADKPEEGGVVVSAVDEDDRLCIVVSDDGRGPEASERFERDETGAARLAVRGLGTAERLTTERLGGTLRLEAGKNGTRVSLLLPALSDVHRALIFAHGGVTYALPTALVVASAAIHPGDLVHDASDWPFVRRDDALLRIFAADGTRPLPQISAYLIVETGRATFALAADRVPYSAIVTRSAPGRVRALDREMDEITVPLLTDVVP